MEYVFIIITPGSTLTRNGRIPSMGQIDLFKIIRLEYLMPHNCKISVLRIVTGSYNCLLRIIISYFEPYKSVQKMSVMKKNEK